MSPEELETMEHLVHKNEMLQKLVEDHCETDTNVRNLARPVLEDFGVDGDSYGVPPLENIVENLIAKIKS